MRRSSPHYFQSIISIAIVLLLVASLAESKIVKKTLRPAQIKRSKNIVYVTKFAMDVGRGEYKAKANFDSYVKGPDSKDTTFTTLQLSVIIDHDWERFSDEQDCSNIARRSSHIQDIDVPFDTTFSPVIKGILTSRRRQHVWFFVLHDCKGGLDKINSSKLNFEIEILNTDGTHYPSDEGNFVWYYFLLFLCFTGIFLSKLKAMAKRFTVSDEIDWPLLLSQVCVGLWAMSHLMSWMHWLIYGTNGNGLFIFDLFAQIFSNSCGFLLTIVLVMLSWGWTVKQLNQDFYDTLIPLGIILGILQIMIVGLGKLTDDSQAKYHQYDGWAGYTILVFRLALCVYFVFGIKNTLTVAKQVVRPFIQKLGILGILYFLAFPILIVVSLFVAPYVQHKVMKFGLILLESIAVLFIHVLFTNKNTGYYRLSESANTILPNHKFNN